MKRILISWIGNKDFESCQLDGGEGPILAALRNVRPDLVYLLYNQPDDEVSPYVTWLRERTSAAIEPRHFSLSSPTEYAEIYQASETMLHEVWTVNPRSEYTIFITPGTPAMQAVWVLLGKTRYDARFLQSSKEQGVQFVDIPFAISAEFLPSGSASEGLRLREMVAAPVLETADFDRIITAHPRLLTLKRRAAVLARFDVPVLILGETGTGKELFARAIHNSSVRNVNPFVALNCGAIPPDLIDSTLFGHIKGAFTGAVRDQAGAFEQANGGTLFLDELGELSAPAQVRLLRVLQEGVITRVGASTECPVDVRLIAATHRDLQAGIAEHSFREDLYYRIAVGVLELPPLRERHGDLIRLIEHFLASIPASLKIALDLRLSPGARNRLLRHTWPGNVRELHATLVRAALWTPDGLIDDAAIDEALTRGSKQPVAILDRPLGAGFDLDALLGEVERHYLQQAIALAGGAKTQASRLLGLGSHQVLTNRLRRHGMEEIPAGPGELR